MQPIAIVCLLLGATAVSFAAEARGIYRNSAYPGKCYMSAALILSPGEEAKNPNIPCGRIVCQKDGVAIFQTCSVEQFEGYKQSDYVDASGPYPKCCERKLIKA